MARLKVLTAEQIHDSELRDMMQQTGDEMFGIYGHCPESFKAFLQFYRPLKYGGILSFALKELVRLKVATLNACVRWQQAREPLEKAPRLYRELLPKLQGEAELSEREAAALAFAERLAIDHHAIDAGFMAYMRQLFSDPEIVELGFVTAAFIMYGRLHVVFGTAPMPTATHELLSGHIAEM